MKLYISSKKDKESGNYVLIKERERERVLVRALIVCGKKRKSKVTSEMLGGRMRELPEYQVLNPEAYIKQKSMLPDVQCLSQAMPLKVLRIENSDVVRDGERDNVRSTGPCSPWDGLRTKLVVRKYF